MNLRNSESTPITSDPRRPALALLLGVVALGGAASAQSALPGSCTVRLVNEVARVRSDGTWHIPNLSANLGPVRARLTCVDDGVTRVGASRPFAIRGGRMNAIPRIEIGDGVATPESIELSLPAALLTAAGQSEPASVTATFSDGSRHDVSAAADGTVYSTTDPTVASIDADGLLTAHASGRVLVLALHEAILDTAAVTVSLGGDSDGDGLADDFELANGLDPGDPVDALEDLDGDGLANRREFELGTDLAERDSDGDGLADGEEASEGEDGFLTSPLLADSDGDGVRDALEIESGTDPTDPASVDYGPLLVRLTATPAAVALVHNTAVPDEVSRRVRIDGLLADGTVVDLTSRGTAYASSDAAVAGFGAEPGRIFAGADGMAVVTVDNSGFEASIEVSVTTFAPQALSFLSIPGFANGVAVADGYVYVAAGATGLQVVDASDPKAPFIVGSLDTRGNANSVDVAGGFAYVADGGEGLQVIDVSVTSLPVLVGSADTPGIATDLVVEGERVYVADGGAGVSVIDVAVPTEPRRLGGVDTPGNARGIDAGGGYVVVADALGGVHVIDASDPSAPFIAGSTRTRATGSRAADVAVRGRSAYVADGSDSSLGGLVSVDFSIPTTPVVVGSSSTRFGPTAVALDRNVALAADFFLNSIPVFDIRTTPSIRGTVDDSRGDFGKDLAVQDGLVYLVGDRFSLRDNGTTGDSGLHIGRYALYGDDAGVAPSVEITAPADGHSVFERRSLRVRAAASDDILVRSVDFLVDGETVASDASSPFEFVLTVPAEPGTLVLGAVATDLGGRQGFAEEVSVTVLPDAVPTVGVVSPAAGSRFTEGTLVPVAVVASADVAISRVDVFVDGGAVATLDTSPYRFDFPVPVGASQLTFTAVATNEVGQSATSEPVAVSVDPDRPPFVTILEPRDGAEVVEESTVRVVTGLADDLGIAAVEFFVDGSPVFRDVAEPFELDLEVASGISRLAVSALAVDTVGQTTWSRAVTLTVVPDPHTTIEGSVVLADGIPVTGAAVTAAGVSTTTYGDGAFTLEDVPTNLGPITVEAVFETSPGDLVGASAAVEPIPGVVLAVGEIVVSRALTVGMVSNIGDDSVSVFNADTDSLIGTVPLGSDLRVGDCSLSQDPALGYVTDGTFASQVWVIVPRSRPTWPPGPTR